MTRRQRSEGSLHARFDKGHIGIRQRRTLDGGQDGGSATVASIYFIPPVCLWGQSLGAESGNSGGAHRVFQSRDFTFRLVPDGGKAIVCLSIDIIIRSNT